MPLDVRLVCTLGKSGAIMMGREKWSVSGLPADLSVGYTGILSVRKFIKSILRFVYFFVCVLSFNVFFFLNPNFQP